MKSNSYMKCALAACAGGLLAFTAVAAPPPIVSDDPNEHEDAHGHELLSGTFERTDPSADLIARDAAVADIVSDAPFAKVIKNLAPAGRG